ncbi:MAG: hypothetical protein HGA54_02300 [Actinobacteria bacterium]|nr:hypothetical protein [Actinomycetota bacterium]
MEVLTPSIEQAQRTLCDVATGDIIVGTVFTPRSGQMPARMKSVHEVSQFLEDLTGRDYAVVSRKNIHHIDYSSLVTWIRDTVGDSDLATVVDELISDGRAFGMLSGEVKEVLSDRVRQCERVLGPSLTEEGLE